MAKGTWHETYYGDDKNQNNIWDANEYINDSAYGLSLVYTLKNHDSCVLLHSWVPPATVLSADTQYMKWQIPNDSTFSLTLPNQFIQNFTIETFTAHKMVLRYAPTAAYPYAEWSEWER